MASSRLRANHLGSQGALWRRQVMRNGTAALPEPVVYWGAVLGLATLLARFSI